MFSSISVTNVRGLVELENHIGLTIHASDTCRTERRRAGRTWAYSPGVASSFVDLPGTRTEVSVRGRAAILQSKIAVTRLQLIASEDHDCSPKLDRLGAHQGVRDVELLRLAIWSRRTHEMSPLVERALVTRLVQLTRGKIVDWRGGLPPSRILQLSKIVSDRLLTVTVTEMSEAAGLTLYHFSREFKRATGETPWAYVIGRRLQEAVNLLRSTNLSTSEVAAMSGFSHPSHLSRHMQGRLGITPGELRRVLRS